ncbi:MAG: hypothetical protein JXK07_16250 [Spirochaetes bacterium]|nr:hypothetical protein [Spirochaetota bacterium]MBN2770636.1 hypothetical protein [Spirochaetota bacterium]
MAAIDELTSLFNRRHSMSLFNHELSNRNLADLSVIFFNIDNIKRLMIRMNTIPGPWCSGKQVAF